MAVNTICAGLRLRLSPPLLPRPFAPYLITPSSRACLHKRMQERPISHLDEYGIAGVFTFREVEFFPFHRDGKDEIVFRDRLEIGMFRAHQHPTESKEKRESWERDFQWLYSSTTFPSFPFRHRKVSDRRSRGNREEAAKIFARVEPREPRAPTACVSSVHPL